MATPPGFLDDNDQHFEMNYARRGLVSTHTSPAGAPTVDFVTMFLRNMSTSERAYANILLAADLAMEMRISGVQASSPVYGDVLLVDADGEAELVATVDPVTNALTIEVTSSGIFDASLNPVIEFDPPVEGNLSAAPVLSATGAVTCDRHQSNLAWVHGSARGTGARWGAEAARVLLRRRMRTRRSQRRRKPGRSV